MRGFRFGNVFIVTRKFPRKPYPIPDLNGQSLYPFSDRNGAKTQPFGAVHTYMAYIREYPGGRYMGFPSIEISVWIHTVVRPSSCGMLV